MIKIVLEISYNGANYSGWQKQSNAISIQQIITSNISSILNEDIVLVASGRTDKGVSAIKQVAHFETSQKVVLHDFLQRLNYMLPRDIRIIGIYKGKEDFHARYSVTKKTYCYTFYVSKYNLPVYDQFATHVKPDIDMHLFETQLKEFVGKHDFTSFCASGSSSLNKEREIYDVKLVRINDMLYSVYIIGEGFLYNMARIIMGTLFDIAQGKLNSTVKDILQNKDRKYAGVTASEKGLMLYDVEY